jgi:malate dehydrogenase (quinone)
MVSLVEKCFANKLSSGGWADRLKKMIPSYGQSLVDNAALCRQVRADTAAILKINDIPSCCEPITFTPGTTATLTSSVGV